MVMLSPDEWCRAEPPPGAHSHASSPRLCRGDTRADDRRVARGAQVRRRWDQQEATFVEEHQMGVQALRVFFYRRPSDTGPARDGRFIALDGPALGFLARPAGVVRSRPNEPVHSHAKVRRMTVAIRRWSRGRVRNPRPCTPQEEAGELPLRAGRHFGGRPGAGFAVKAFEPRRRTTFAPRGSRTVRNTPSRRATSVTDAPAFSSSSRPAPSLQLLGLPCGRMPRQ